MWDFLLCCQLFHLVQQDVHLELGAKILQTPVAEGLSVVTGTKNKNFLRYSENELHCFGGIFN